MEIYPLQKYPIIVPRFRPMWLQGLLTPRCITLFPSSALLQPPQYSGSIIPYIYIWDWLRELVNGSSKETVIEPVLSGLRKWLIQDLWVQSKLRARKRAPWVYQRYHNVSNSKMRHWRETSESWEEKQRRLESTVKLKSNKVMTGKEPHFRIHRQLVNNK